MGLSELRLLAPGETSDMVVCPFPSFALQSASSRFSLTGKEILFDSGDKNTSQATPHMTTNEVVDLSAYMSTNGVLTWDAPAGNWMILRFGQTSIGEHNHINTGIGYHVDYLNPDALQKHFELGIDPMLNALSPEARAQVGGIYEDSFELPYHTWTEDFAAEFEARRGYSILPWMPVLAERVVNSQAESERFLWDYRRTIADLYITHYEAFRDLAHARGLETMVQGAGPQTYNFDALTQLGKADIPQGEFWSTLYKPGVEQEDTFRIWNNETCETTRQAASAAHIYGKNIVAAEAFTGYGRPFSLDFFDIKGLGDRALCNGVNRFVYHLFMTQAREEYNGKPVVVRLHALDYNRRSTWFDQSHLFNEYLARCSAMMQSGSPVADIAYYMGEGAPAFMPPREFISPEMPAGYDYDGCNTEILLQAAVENGRITFPSGTSYALLVFPTGLHSLTPAVLNHLKTLVQAGAVILGDKPEYSPELLGNDVADAQVQSLADELWGTSGTASGENVYGSGKVIWGKTVQEAMASTGCEPACEITGADTIRFIQRSTDDGEVFFLSQQAGATANFTASFKAESTVVPQLWDPATGMREPVAVFKQANGRVDIPIKLAPKGSVFVVLKSGIPDTHLASAVYDGLVTVPLTILSADYTSTVDTNKTADVTDAVRDAVTNNSLHIRVFFRDLGIPDPAPGEVKRLTVYYTQGEESSSVSNTDMKYVTIDAVESDADYRIAKEEGNIVLTSFVTGDFQIEWDNSAADTITVSSLPDPLDLSTDWELTFEGLGQTNNMQNLISWTDLVPEEQKYYSGTVTYRKSFNWSGSGTAELNLGSMKNIAEVYLNGTLIDTLWKPPYRTDITSALLQGNNDLEIKVTNLRVNRVTGDYALPQEQKDAYYYGHVEKYRPGVESGLDGPLPSGLFGPVTLKSASVRVLKRK